MMYRHSSILAVTAAIVLFGQTPLRFAHAGEPTKTAGIVGKVVDETGQPVANAAVILLTASKTPPATTAADGTFQLPSPGPESEKYTGHLLVKGPTGKLGFQSATPLKGPPSRIVLREPHKVMFEVTDGKGQPVVGAKTLVTTHSLAVAIGQTDANGKSSLAVPVEVLRHCQVLALKEKVGFDYRISRRRVPVLPQGEVKNPVQLTLDGARSVRVRPVDRAGEAIVGVHVVPSRIQTPGQIDAANLSGILELSSKATDDGAVFEWLPAKFARQIEFAPNSDQYYPADRSVSIYETTPAAELTPEFLPYERLSGNVMFPGGRPAEGIRIEARGAGNGSNDFVGSVVTDANGRYAFAKAYSEQSYIIAVADRKWAAPYSAGVIVRAGKPVEDVDFVLAPATRVHGRISVMKGDTAVPNIRIAALIEGGRVPEELLKRKDGVYRANHMWIATVTGSDGRYELFLGPGNYRLYGPPRLEVEKLVIPANQPPAEIVKNFALPRAEVGPLAGRVVDEKGQPISGATVNAVYTSSKTQNHFREIKTGKDGAFKTTRAPDPMVLHAKTADGLRAGVARSKDEEENVEIVVKPVASADGKLVDLNGKPLQKVKTFHGLNIRMDGEKYELSTDAFGGTVTTDDEGKISLSSLIPGEQYHLYLQIGHSFRVANSFAATNAKPIDLGVIRVDPELPKPYVPPTPGERTAKSFAQTPELSPIERKNKALLETRREYTRPLLLFGRPDDPACVELFRLLSEESAERPNRKEPVQTPNSLRWEFELASLDSSQPDVGKLAESLGVDLVKSASPVLAVLNADGALAATFPLVLDEQKKLDDKALTAFMIKHRLPTRDAERMLADAMKKAKAEDKRVFFISSASWCPPCRLLGRYLEPWKKELEEHFVFVKLDMSRDEHATQVRDRIQQDRDGGVPWFAILDHNGKVLATSNAPHRQQEGKDANIGFPAAEAEINHFMQMISRNAPRFSAAQLARMRAAFDAKK